MDAPRNPGSLKEAMERYPEMQEKKVVELYGESIDIYRHRLATRTGLHPEDLHVIGPIVAEQMLEHKEETSP